MTATTIAGLVSTIIPVHNRSALLREAVASVLAQSYRPIEVIVVDDGSTDDTHDVVDDLANESPDEIHAVHQRNAGPGLAREAGRRLARGEFIQYLDSDDLLLPNKFEWQVAGLIDEPECGIAYGQTRYRVHDSESKIHHPWKRTGERIVWMFPSFLQARWWGTSTPLYRRKLTDIAGPWLSLWAEEDWEYDCRLAAMGTRLHFVQDFVSEERDHSGGRLSRDGRASIEKLRDRTKAHAHILQHARRAAIDERSIEMQHFARELFLLARQCGAAGLTEESRDLFRLAKAASGTDRGSRLDFRLYEMAARNLGLATHWAHFLCNGQVPQMTPPKVSVVMSVYNGAATLPRSIPSILSQEGVELEFVIVNDGSTDSSGVLLDEFARTDHRIRVIHQENRGLTRALVAGCAAARGTYLARQDADDFSLPGRLRKQVDVMESQPLVALVSCGARFVGPNQEVLYEKSDAGDSTDCLLTLDWDELRGPAGHGSTLFRRELYEEAGGYREQFYFAQDLDLWTRLVEHGRHFAIPDVLYEVSVALDSISSLQRNRQIECARIILEAARLRRAGLDQSAALARAAAVLPGRITRSSADRAAALYFVGVCLRNRADPRARQYFRDALRANPLHLKSALRLLMG